MIQMCTSFPPDLYNPGSSFPQRRAGGWFRGFSGFAMSNRGKRKVYFSSFFSPEHNPGPGFPPAKGWRSLALASRETPRPAHPLPMAPGASTYQWDTTVDLFGVPFGPTRNNISHTIRTKQCFSLAVSKRLPFL